MQTSFRTFPKGRFDHGLWTGFALGGAHGEARCSDCHVPLRKPDRFGRTWRRAKGKNCADCHKDPHGGQFQMKDHTRCERCHESARSFTELSFRHNFDSRFRLDKAHAPLACSECHKPFRKDGVEIVRYRPMGRKCTHCHRAQRDPLRRRQGGSR